MQFTIEGGVRRNSSFCFAFDVPSGGGFSMQFPPMSSPRMYF